jgi:hypothetical protein
MEPFSNRYGDDLVGIAVRVAESCIPIHKAQFDGRRLLCRELSGRSDLARAGNREKAE